MNKELLIKRRKELLANVAVHQENIDKFLAGTAQAEANIQACNGAIQDCDHWLAELEKVEENFKTKSPGKNESPVKKILEKI